MSYQVLARKWRPDAFADVAGQEHVLRALGNALSDGRLHHAYLFSGTRGVGKTTVARILAKCLNCETGVTPTPCGECASCRELAEGRFVDLIEVDAASRTKVEDTRELLDNVQYAPTRGRYKIYLIDEVHMLSGHSFNALLKTLEEPPEHVKFLLATTDPQKLPVTVLSRCLQFHLKRLPLEVIRGRLAAITEAEGVAAEAAGLARLARAADGSMRDALSLLDQALAFGGGTVRDDEVAAMLGAVERRHVLEVLEALAAGDGQALLAAAGRMAEGAVDFDDALAELVGTVHTLALAQQVPATLSENEPEREALADLAARIPAEDLQLYYQIGLHARRDLPYAPDPATGFEMALLRMLAFRPAEAAPPSPPAPSSAPPPAPPREMPATGRDGAGSGVSEPPPTAHADAPPPAAPAPPRPEGDGAVWASIAAGLGGPLGALASHCAWVGRDGERVILQMDEAHRCLLSDERRERLLAALAERFDGVTRLEIRVGDAGWTPAQEEAHRREQAQRRAEQAVTADPAVEEICRAFDGRLQSVQAPPADDSQPNH